MDKIRKQDIHDITIKHHNTEDKNILIKIITSILLKNDINLLFGLGKSGGHL